ncbi:helix-turn-helix domain-containing protein [Streptomyces sp. NPDC048442]|uniref:helix-turn-helix domain-containing protein n=1 Tax=Streptomyces sp. NPDC048442 TaxID=3154823 RepID=UPI003431995E
MIEGEELHSLGLGEVEGRVYEALLKEQASCASELARLLEVPVLRIDEALTSLSVSGFTVPATDGAPRPAAPAAAIRTLIHRRQAELHIRSAELEQLMMSADRIAGRLTAGSQSASEGGIEIVTGHRQIGERAESLLASAEQEVVILDRPPYAKADADHPDRPPALDIEALLARGITVRAVIDREGLGLPGRMRSLTALAARGLRARVTSGVPTKLIGIDHRITLLPPSESADPTASALVVGDALLRNALLPLFETVWDRSIPLGSSGGTGPTADPVSGQQRELLGLLAAGLKDEAIARRLGVHVHTARRRITRLLAALNAETRFQAGAQAATRGWLA